MRSTINRRLTLQSAEWVKQADWSQAVWFVLKFNRGFLTSDFTQQGSHFSLSQCFGVMDSRHTSGATAREFKRRTASCYYFTHKFLNINISHLEQRPSRRIEKSVIWCAPSGEEQMDKFATPYNIYLLSPQWISFVGPSRIFDGRWVVLYRTEVRL